MMGCQLSCLLDGEGFPRKKKKKGRKGRGRDAHALNQFFFKEDPCSLPKLDAPTPLSRLDLGICVIDTIYR